MWKTGVMEAGMGKVAEGIHLRKSNSVTCSDITVRSLRPYPVNLTSLAIKPFCKWFSQFAWHRQ